MAERTRYLVAYDIREQRRLRRVHKVAKNFGEPLQYSLFVCDLTAIELLSLKAALRAEAHLGADSIGIFDLGEPTGRGVRCVEFIGVSRDLPEPGEAAIW